MATPATVNPTATQALHAEIAEIMAIARQQADRAGIADREAFAARMVAAAMRGKVDRWILDSERAASS